MQVDDSDGEKLSSILKEKLKLTREESANIKFLHECREVEVVANESVAEYSEPHYQNTGKRCARVPLVWERRFPIRDHPWQLK